MLNIPGIPQLNDILPKLFPIPKNSIIGKPVESHYGAKGIVLEVTQWESPEKFVRRPYKALVQWHESYQSEVYLKSVILH
jgi:hypothetical protein